MDPERRVVLDDRAHPHEDGVGFRPEALDPLEVFRTREARALPAGEREPTVERRGTVHPNERAPCRGVARGGHSMDLSEPVG